MHLYNTIVWKSRKCDRDLNKKGQEPFVIKNEILEKKSFCSEMIKICERNQLVFNQLPSKS